MDLADGALAAGAVAASGWLGSRAWRLFGRELWRLARTVVGGCLAVKRERARRDRIVAVVTALAAGAKQRALVAVGNSILTIAYYLLSDPHARFNDLGVDFHDRLHPNAEPVN